MCSVGEKCVFWHISEENECFSYMNHLWCSYMWLWGYMNDGVRYLAHFACQGN